MQTIMQPFERLRLRHFSHNIGERLTGELQQKPVVSEPYSVVTAQVLAGDTDY